MGSGLFLVDQLHGVGNAVRQSHHHPRHGVLGGGVQLSVLLVPVLVVVRVLPVLAVVVSRPGPLARSPPSLPELGVVVVEVVLLLVVVVVIPVVSGRRLAEEGVDVEVGVD